MSRKKRIWYPGAAYHVMSRGNRRTVLFKDNSDYMRFMECIAKAKEQYGFRIHSICLMSNHFHIALETDKVELWKIMQKILHPYSMDFNNKYHFTGHVFESRYTACLIEDDRYFLEVSRYIHLNPVKAKMVREPLDYEYSSYGKFVNDEGYRNDRRRSKCTEMIYELTDTSRVLSCFRNDPREQYRMFVEGKISHAEQEMLISKDIGENELWLPW
jgi:REP element-mobilizing transposase RayT